MPSLPYMFSVPDGDELLFRIMTTIGWYGQFEPLLGTDPDAEFVSWNDIDRAFLLRPSRGTKRCAVCPSPSIFLFRWRNIFSSERGSWILPIHLKKYRFWFPVYGPRDEYPEQRASSSSSHRPEPPYPDLE